MDLGYAFMLLGGVQGPGSGPREKRKDGEEPARRERPREGDAEPDRSPPPLSSPSPGLGDPSAPDANPIDPRVFRR